MNAKHIWLPADTSGTWLALRGHSACLVRTKALPKGFMWQFRKHAGYAASVDAAKDIVESRAELGRWVE